MRSPLSDGLVELVAAAGARAAAALAAGDVEGARRLLGDALAALGSGVRVPPLRVLPSPPGGQEGPGEGGVGAAG